MTASGALSEAVSKVESQLASFWASTSTDDAGGRKARAATMNFVTVSIPSEIDALRASIEDLAQTRAGRVFLMTLDGRLPPWDLEPDVSAVCRKEGETIVCYDRIELHFGAMAAVRAASVLSALSLSEVPTMVELAKGAPGPLSDALVRAADRVIVDSAHTSVTHIAEIAGKTRAAIGDRAYVRTFSWREFVARFFDEAPGAEACVGRVEIERAPFERSDPAALLLGWLASRLGWHFESATRAIDAGGMPIEIAVREHTDPDVPHGELAAVRLIASFNARPLFCTCERKPGQRNVRWALNGPRSVEHEHPLGFRDEGWVLGKAIDATEGDDVYRAAVVAAAAWAHFAEATR